MLQAALDHQLAEARIGQCGKQAIYSNDALDRLISFLEELRERILKLPPRSRGLLNECFAKVLRKLGDRASHCTNEWPRKLRGQSSLSEIATLALAVMSRHGDDLPLL
jgi:hypothetical protein